jgi:3-deoxy-D-manno-octulosonate 8-phosphate phosphatase (KDO 8-P phosphatase)
MLPTEVQQRFEAIGGQFFVSADLLVSSLQNVSCFLFDWDGVFNDGMKSSGYGSPFGEADSMGINLLRLSHWLKFGVMPRTGIITGATNEAAQYFAQREGLEFCVRGFTDKGMAFRDLTAKMNINPSEVAFFFDDVLDLPIAQHSAIRFQVRRDNGPLFNQYLDDHGLRDYLTSAPGGQCAVRECCELIMGLCYDFGGAVNVRREYGEKYQQYLTLRKAVETVLIASE